MDIKQSKQWGAYLKTLGWHSEYIPQAIRIKKLLFWSIIKIQRPQKVSTEFLKKVDVLAKENKALFVKIEPDFNTEEKIFSDCGYHKSNEPLSTTKTIIIDLNPNLEELLKTFSKDTRQKIKHVPENIQISTEKLQDIKKLKDFYTLFAKTGKQKKFWVPSFKEIEGKARSFINFGFIITLYQEKKPAATVFILIENKTAYYEHAAYDPTLTKDGPYLLLWELIKECKKRNLCNLDLCGIYDERFSEKTKRWKNFTIFKNKWGGDVLSYPVPYTKYYPKNFIPLIPFLFL
ncbi:MAG: GNAT family N-acetyltransferase [bacterium]